MGFRKGFEYSFESPAMLDLVFSGGTIVDGSGNPWFHSDIGVKGNRIAAFGKGLEGELTIDVSGKIVCPGFIDTHSHSDLTLFNDPEARSAVCQGITLELLGQDGISLFPVTIENRLETRQRLSGVLDGFEVDISWEDLGGYLNALEREKPSVKGCIMIARKKRHITYTWIPQNIQLDQPASLIISP